MPLDPPFDADDSQPWWQFGPPLRITVHPAAPPNPQPGIRAASEGGNDWSAAGGRPDDRVMPDGYPNDWGMSDGYPDDWIAPAPSTAQTQPVPSAQPAAINPSISNRSAASPDPYATYWATIPASRVGAMAWHPPIFPNSFGQFQLTPTTPPSTPPLPTGGLLGALANLQAAPSRPSIPAGGLLEALANLQPTPSVPASSGWRDLPSATSGAQQVPTFQPAIFSDLPFDAASGVSGQYPPHSLPGTQAGLTPAWPNQSVGTNGFLVFNANGILPPGLGATPLATSAAASFARGRSSPTASARAGSESNPFSRILNAVNPISPAFAADEEGWGFPPVIAQALAQGLIDAATAKILAERAKVLQDAQDAWKDFREVAQGRASSRTLGVALEASGVSRPQG